MEVLLSKKCLSWLKLPREKVFLGMVLLLAFFLRLVSLGKIPPSLARDEASIGYTAYSILKTGKDEHGVFLPLSLKSFGDYKLPLYVYVDIPFVFLFGLKEWVVRLPSALFGTITVLLVYLLVKELFLANKETQFEALPLTSALFLALNPWHFYFSRISYETNLSLFLTVLGALLFLKRKGKSLLPSAFCFGLTMFTYHGAHVFTPIFVLGLLVLYWSRVKKDRFLPFFLLVFFGFVLTAYFLTLNQAGRTKMGGIGFFRDPVVTYFRSERKRTEHKKITLGVRLIHNRFLIFPYQIGQNYLRVFSSSFLFDKGGENPLHNLEEFGNFYLLDALLIGAGIVFLLWQRKKETKFLAWWILVSPLASSITKDSPHSARSFTIVPPLVIFSAFGFSSFKDYLLRQKKLLGKLGFFFLTFCFVFSVFWYLEAYFVHFPLNRARFFNYGYKQAVQLAQSLPGVKKVVMVGVENSPYIYYLFYQKYNPDKFRQEVEYYPPTTDQFWHVKSFGRYEFANTIDWPASPLIPNALFIDVVRGVPKNFPIDGCIRLPSGEPFLAWYSTLPEEEKKEAKEKFGNCDLSYLWQEK